jgi:hypothetical protein
MKQQENENERLKKKQNGTTNDTLSEGQLNIKNKK